MTQILILLKLLSSFDQFSEMHKMIRHEFPFGQIKHNIIKLLLLNELFEVLRHDQVVVMFIKQWFAKAIVEIELKK